MSGNNVARTLKRWQEKWALIFFTKKCEKSGEREFPKQRFHTEEFLRKESKAAGLDQGS